ncbi:IS110 family transposase [Plantactinospora sp. KLBMP9567]|uniref:IS110 family transposase n=1 Tax=Plantactinospora sp. KLBMP9567 TaxID=3085900 RepID=UPI0029822CE3|nr:IS110 family transposase [Plantactinospora sp. KLBMP9567]MDW5326740.1 IS110 family transposase [Plantactinospora sp. KLBMP9567]
MEVIVERCAGIDIGKRDVKACIRVPDGAGRWRVEVRTFTTMTSELLLLRDWLAIEGVTTVGMEATGAYWKPVYYLLEDSFSVQLLNARHLHNVPGRKTDVIDAEWICRMVQHGLVRPSFVPPAPIRQLRDLTRYRTEVVRERVRDIARLEKLLEDAGIKLSAVVADLLGKSARAMLDALIAGQRDPQVLADMALRRMKSKRAQLVEALTGRFSDHHAFLVRAMLDRIDAAATTVERISARIAEQIDPMRRQVELLSTIPGISTRIAEVIIAEIGVDMVAFPSAGHLASWAAVCPGNNESAGKQLSGKTRNGNAALRAALGEAAQAITRTKDTYLAARYKRVAARRGKKRAVVAVQHSMLVAVWHMLTHDVAYHDLGAGYFTERAGKSRQTRRLVTQLNNLGYAVRLDALATA